MPVSMPREWQSVVEEQIRQAQERGDFEDLPGKGKPIPGLRDPDDEDWWIKSFVRREGLPTDALLPPSLRLRKEVERLPETVRGMPTEAAVRVAVADLNDRIRAWILVPTGPPVAVRPVDVDEVLRGWRAGREPAPAEPTEEPGAASESAGRPSRRWSWRRLLDSRRSR
jgi:hypothetical protein